MDSRVLALHGALASAFALALLAGCSSAVSQPASQTPVIVAESVSGAGYGNWTTTTTAGAPTQVPVSQWQAAPVPQGYAAGGRAPVLTRPAVENGSPSMPPPPPPPRVDGVAAPSWSTPAPTSYAPVTYSTPMPGQGVVCAPAAPTPVAGVQVVPQRTYTGCGLPCEQGISQWHVRGVGGWVFYEGKDPAEECNYWGVDVGRTHCGCWGLDAYYRTNSGVFDRNQPPMSKDGGLWHHVGGKVTMERAFSTGSRIYGWAGVGGGYYWTEDYVDNDSGVEAYGEAGLGYVLSRNFRIRAGVNVHAMDTDVTRRNPADDGDSRWLWQVAPVLQLEGDF